MKILGYILAGLSGCMLSPASKAQFTYTANGDNTLTITGYTGPAGSVTIPGTINGLTVSQIGTSAFNSVANVTSISIPNTVTIIGMGAFNACTALTNINIPSGVTGIAEGTFSACENLANINIPNGVTSIGDFSFAECFKLQNLNLPNSVTTIQEDAFFECTTLSNVTIGTGLTTIGQQAFGVCPNLTNVLFQGNVPTSVGSQVFGSSPSDPVFVYRYQGTTGWGATFAGAPVVAITAPSPAPPFIVSQPTNMLVNALAPASFSVGVTGTLAFSYQWYLNNSNILNATFSTYSIANVRQADLGAYFVLITNQYGAATSSVANLNIHPYLSSPFTGAVTYWGKDTALSVDAWGSGLTYQWFDNGVAISGATNSTLVLPAVQFTNAGLYSVVVSSPYGSVTNAPQQLVVNAANVALGLFPGVIITGTVGYSYVIQSTTDLANSNLWSTETNIMLTQPVQIWNDNSTDTTQPGNPHKYYRVQPGP